MENNILIIIFLTCSYYSVCDPNFRITQGTDSINNDFSFVVSIEWWKSVHPHYEILRFCTGSLISTNWVLTAAHCTSNLRLVVRYGNMTVPSNETQYFSEILKTVHHPNFRLIPFIRNDISLLKIKNLMIDVGILSAVEFNTLTGLAVSYAGFGLINQMKRQKGRDIWKQAAHDMTKPLQIGHGVVCRCPSFGLPAMVKPGYRSNTWVRHMVLCVWPKCSSGQHGPYLGDSGGPLLLDGKIIAVISGGVPGLYSVWTPVSPYLGWIRDTVNRN